MDNQNHRLKGVSLVPESIFVSEIGDKIKFAYPQSSMVIVGDYRVNHTLPYLLADLVNVQFEYGLFLCQDYINNDFIQSIRRDGGYLCRLRGRDISNNNLDSETLLEIFKEKRRVIISVKNLSQELRIQYWKLLNMQIRTFFLKKKVPKLPYFIMWIDKALSESDPLIFEYFRILGLWGEEFGLRFTLFLDQYSLLSSPARTLFGIVVIVPGLSMTELSGIIDPLNSQNSLKNQLYKLYHQMGNQKMLIVSPFGIFSPFFAQSGL